LQLVQIAGAVLILVSFAGLQAGRLRPNGPVYLVLNLAGAALLAISAYVEEQWGFVVLEVVWALVGGFGLFRALRRRDAKTSA
jgi:membrane-bound ClpP family serine protease